MAVKKRQSSMADVAVLAGVSLGTVSNYFNRPDKVSAERRRRVEAAVDQLGFVAEPTGPRAGPRPTAGRRVWSSWI